MAEAPAIPAMPSMSQLVWALPAAATVPWSIASASMAAAPAASPA